MRAPGMKKSGVPHPLFSHRVLRVRLAYGRVLRPLMLRRSMQLLLDAICGFAAVLTAYALRFDMALPPWALHQMWAWAALLLVLDPLTLSLFGGYRPTWQFFGLRDVMGMVKRLTVLNLLLLLVPMLTPHHHLMPYSIVVLDLLLVLLYSGGIRLLRRLDHEALYRIAAKDHVLIVGTSETVASAIRQLLPLYGPALCGAVLQETSQDTSQQSSQQGQRILGVPVLGGVSELQTCLQRHHISLLFLCSAQVDKLPELMQSAADFDVTVKFLPSVLDLVGNNVRVSRNVLASSLRQDLEAERAQLHPEVLNCLRDRVVLVTGAGGSIGSELVRQIATARVRKLILMDQDENAVFELLGELGTPDFLHPVIADIRDRVALQHIFSRERPHVVLHAGAYKHVPMMEANPCEAVLNNVCGTRSLLEASIDFEAERFVMISSDKAVRPSSVMGATKRLAELMIQHTAQTGGRGDCPTTFACVRFGNVLGSRGSVIPVFLKQIEQGGPVTVTHDQMTRYFMTIPQAVRLVLQAATLASCGDIYMLDMGDPVRIVNLAREVIFRSGLTPGKDIEIKIVGSRPGEKLHEQLWLEDARIAPTAFEQIFRVHAEPFDTSFPELLFQLEDAAHAYRPDDIRPLLHRLPIGYMSSHLAVMAGAVD